LEYNGYKYLDLAFKIGLTFMINFSAISKKYYLKKKFNEKLFFFVENNPKYLG
jgi:hypothetical protein